jgi:hypothetical protein
LSLQPILPHLIVLFLSKMAFAVKFEDQTGMVAVKIRDIWPDGMLAAELVADESAIPQLIPEPRFGGGLGLPELASAALSRRIETHGSFSL